MINMINEALNDEYIALRRAEANLTQAQKALEQLKLVQQMDLSDDKLHPLVWRSHVVQAERLEQYVLACVRELNRAEKAHDNGLLYCRKYAAQEAA